MEEEKFPVGTLKYNKNFCKRNGRTKVYTFDVHPLEFHLKNQVERLTTSLQGANELLNSIKSQHEHYSGENLQ